MEGKNAMIQRNIFGTLIILALLFVAVPQALAQATLGVSSTTTVATDIGYAELAGNLTLTVLSGTSLASTIQVQYTAPLANNAATDIQISGVAAQSLDYTSNTVTFAFPAGLAPGSRVAMAGVRVRLAGLGLPRVSATVSIIGAGGNTIAAGQSVVTLIDSIREPFLVDYCCSIPLSWTNGQITNPGTSFIIRELFASAFTSSNNYGQTTPSQLRITPFPSIPAGVQLTFPKSFSDHTSPNTGTFTTLSGNDETVPRADGSTSVIYAFSGGITSDTTMETFQPNVNLTKVEPPAVSGTVTFQVALLPIDNHPPGPGVPIPRYDERLVPDEATLVTGSVDLAYPFRIQSDGTYTGIAITNPLDYQVDLTLTAYDASGNLVVGSNITNPTGMRLPRQGQIGMLATEIFGPGLSAAGGGTIRVHGKTPTLEGFYLIGDLAGPRLDGATADLNPMQGWILPSVFHQGPSPSTLIELFNPQTTVANSTINLKDSTGKLLATAAVTLLPNGSMATEVSKVFPTVDPASFSGGYIVGGTDVPIVVRETFGNALDTNVLAAQWGAQKTTFLIAHYATGGGYTTELNILDVDGTAKANITLTALDNNGTPLALASNPVTLSIPAGSQVTRTMDDLFPGLGSSLLTGYLKLDVAPYNQGPFVTVPLVVGSVRFSAANGFASAALPLFLAPSSDFVYSHVAQNLGYYTGITYLNNNPTPTGVTTQVYTRSGTLVGSYTMTLAPGQKVAKLVYELVPSSAGQLGGYVRIRSDHPINSFSLFGTNDGRSLSAIPPQPVID